MSNTFEFRGPATNLGRFGMVKTGEILVLTEKEAECIRSDRRFKAVNADLPPEIQMAIAQRNISEMTREQLVEFCHALRAADPTFQFRADWDHVTLLGQVRQRLDQQNKNPA